MNSPGARPRLAAERAHTVPHFGRNAVLPNDRPLVAKALVAKALVTKAASLPLNDKAPQGVAGLLDQSLPRRAGGCGGVRSLAFTFPVCPIVLRQRGEPRLQRAAKAAQSSGLLLRNFVTERGVLRRTGTGSRRTQRHWRERSHVVSVMPAAGSISRGGPARKPWRASTSSGVVCGPTCGNSGRPAGIWAWAARVRLNAS